MPCMNMVNIVHVIMSGTKTQNAYGIADPHPGVTKMLSDFSGHRKSGYIFGARNGKPLGRSNILRRSLHPILAMSPPENQNGSCHREW